MNKELKEQIADKIIEWIKNPVQFCEEVIGFGKCHCKNGEPCELDSQQIEIINDLARLIRAREKRKFGIKLTKKDEEIALKKGLSVMAGKGLGKTGISAIIVLWFIVCFRKSRVVIVGPKYEQVKRTLWAEIAKWKSHSVTVYGDDCLLNQLIDIQTDLLYVKDVEKDSLRKEWIAYIQSFPKNSSIAEQKAAVQGIHEDYVLVIFDESSGVPDPIFETMQDTMTNPVNIMLVMFNPNKDNGWAIDTQTKMAKYWITKQLNAMNSGLVSKEHIAYMRDKYGEDSNIFRISVLGLPPLADEDALIPWSWIQRAKERWNEYEPTEDEPVIMAIDPGAGGDKSVVCLRHGNKIVRFFQRSTPDSAQLENWVCDLLDEHRPEIAYIDKHGIGWAIHQRIKAKGYKVKGISASESSSNPDKFFALKDELYWRMRESFENDEIAIPPDDEELEGELSLIKLDKSFKDDKIKIISKNNAKFKQEMINKVGYKSPNKADDSAYTYYFRGYKVKGKNNTSKVSLLEGFAKRPRFSCLPKGWMKH